MINVLFSTIFYVTGACVLHMYTLTLLLKLTMTHFFLFPGIQSVACNKLQDNLIKIDLPEGRVVNKSTTGSDAGVT